MKIILLGYMASGKTTVGTLLAKKMSLPFIDLDYFIEEREGKKISEIFKKGEVYFRLQEHKYLQELLKSDKSFVLSLGGGTPCYADNMSYIISSKNTFSIYLKANFKVIANRLCKEKEHRPIVAKLPNDELVEFVAKHIFERSFFYEQANTVINTTNLSILSIVNNLEKIITLNKQ